MTNKIKELAKLLKETQKVQKDNPKMKGFEALEQAKVNLGIVNEGSK